LAENVDVSDQILALAAKEFASRGYLGTNLAIVAKQLGVTRQAIYHYFPHKEDILIALFMRFFDELEGSLEAASEGLLPAERFPTMFQAQVAFIAERPWLSPIFNHEEKNLPRHIANRVRNRRRAIHAKLVQAYLEGVESGSLRPVDVKLTVSMLLGMSGWLHRWYKLDGRLTPQQLAEYAREIATLGISLPARQGSISA
jgi:AcrR family transcriptional regulator